MIESVKVNENKVDMYRDDPSGGVNTPCADDLRRFQQSSLKFFVLHNTSIDCCNFFRMNIRTQSKFCGVFFLLNIAPETTVHIAVVQSKLTLLLLDNFFMRT